MQGSSLPIDVTVQGLHKNEKVQIRYDLADGQVQGEFQTLNEEIQGVNYKLDFGKSLGGIHQPVTYWIHAGDAIAGPYHVDIQIVPLVAIDRIELTYPNYTKLKPRTIQQQGQFEAPEGTIANIYALANQVMTKARLEFDPVLQNKLLVGVRDTVDMQVNKTELHGTWTATLNRKSILEKRLIQYRIKATNTLNESNHDPVLYPIRIIQDLPPEIEFGVKSSNAVEVPLDQSIAIELSARDPDYGLTSISIEGLKENKLTPANPKLLFKEILFESEIGRAHV